MPRAKLPPGADRSAFDHFKSLADSEGETRDCAVRAVAAATGTSYKETLALFADLGRQSKRGVRWELTTKAIKMLGFTYEYLKLEDFNPPSRAARGKHGITSHHPDRFPQMWKNGGRLVCYNNTHVWAVVDGINMDWSRGKSVRVLGIIRLTKV